MTKKLFTMLMAALAFALCQSVIAQPSAHEQLKHFAAKGLSFDYPVEIELEDHGTPSGQHLVIQGQGQAQIMIFSRYAQINTAAELAAARHEVVDGYIETIWEQIHDQDPNVLRTAAQIEVAGAQATGVRLRAVLGNQPGNAEIYSIKLGSRLVLISLIGTDREIAASARAWLAIRRSLKIEANSEAATANLRSSRIFRTAGHYLSRPLLD